MFFHIMEWPFPLLGDESGNLRCADCWKQAVAAVAHVRCGKDQMQTAVCGTSKHTLGWNIIEQTWSIGISKLLIVIILDTFGTLKQQKIDLFPWSHYIILPPKIRVSFAQTLVLWARATTCGITAVKQRNANAKPVGKRTVRKRTNVRKAMS